MEELQAFATQPCCPNQSRDKPAKRPNKDCRSPLLLRSEDQGSFHSDMDFGAFIQEDERALGCHLELIWNLNYIAEQRLHPSH